MIGEPSANAETGAARSRTTHLSYLPQYTTQVLLWRKLVLWTVGAYLILNTGFEIVRIPPVGPGIPIGELALIASLCILNPATLLPKMSRVVWMFPIILWWLLSLSRALIDTSVGGIWSFRDASQAIESLFLIVGFGLANSVVNVEYFFTWLRKILLTLAIYGFIFPFANTLQKISPSLPGLGSGSNSILFQVTNTPILALWSGAWLLLERRKSRSIFQWRDLWAALLIAYSTAFAQGRTLYIQILVLGVMFLFIRRKVAVRWYAVLVLGALLIAAVSISGIGLRGRTGNKISLAYMVQHLASSTGSGEGETAGPAGGVGQRIGWWRHIASQMGQSAGNEAFGLGYGLPLTDFVNNKGALTREPHNSYISVWARLGYTGAAVWVLMQLSLYGAWWRSYKLTKKFGWIRAQNNLILLALFFILLVIAALGEDAFEKPFWAIPYYLFFGVVLRYGIQLRECPELQQ